MIPRAQQSVVVGMSGFFAGGFVASIVHMRPLPKAAFVGAIAALVSTLVWTVLGPKTAQHREPIAGQIADREGTSEV
jgi:hypothetical protein